MPDHRPKHERLPLPEPTSRLNVIRGLRDLYRLPLDEAVRHVESVGMEAAAELIRREREKQEGQS